jgi:hypothetical protein
MCSYKRSTIAAPDCIYRGQICNFCSPGTHHRCTGGQALQSLGSGAGVWAEAHIRNVTGVSFIYVLVNVERIVLDSSASIGNLHCEKDSEKPATGNQLNNSCAL